MVVTMLMYVKKRRYGVELKDPTTAICSDRLCIYHRCVLAACCTVRCRRVDAVVDIVIIGIGAVVVVIVQSRLRGTRRS